MRKLFRPTGPMAFLLVMSITALLFYSMYKFIEYRHAERQNQYVSQPLNK